MHPPTPHLGIYIARSPRDVFDYVLDIGRTPEWRPRMSGAEWLAPGEPGVGSKFRVSAKALGYRFAFELEVTVWDPPHYFAYLGTQGPVRIDSFMEWYPDGDGCRFFIGGDPSTQNRLMALLRPLFEVSLIRQNIADLWRLKDIMESGRDRVAAI